MVFFPNVTLQLYEYSESETTYNVYGEPEKEYKLKNTIPADFQSMSPNESIKEFGEIQQDTYKIYINQDVEVNPTMIVKIGDDTYEIIGTPINNNHLSRVVQHKKVLLKKHRTPEPVVTEAVNS